MDSKTHFLHLAHAFDMQWARKVGFFTSFFNWFHNSKVLADGGDKSMAIEGKGLQFSVGDFKHWEACLWKTKGMRSK